MIRELTQQTRRPWPLIKSEVDLQISILPRLADDLEKRIVRASGGVGQVAVVDTNVVIHYRPIWELPWKNLLKPNESGSHCLRVIEELDEKKYAARPKVADRARRILPQISRRVGADGGPRDIQEGVTFEVPVDPGARLRPLDADEEILTSCEEFDQFGREPVTLVTADTGMTLRAQARQIRVIELGDDYRDVPLTDDPAA